MLAYASSCSTGTRDAVTRLHGYEDEGVAHYHFHVTVVRRREGRRVTQVAAYKFGERIECAASGETYHYSRMNRVVWTGTFAPAGAPEWVFDRPVLWNAVELRETRKNSVLAREYRLALPAELGRAEHVSMLERFATYLVERFNLVADCAIHVPRDDSDGRNMTAVVLVPTRRLENGAFTIKLREMDAMPRSIEVLTELRELWADIQNEALRAAGIDARVDHRSLAEQREDAERSGDTELARQLDREPQRKLDWREMKAKRRRERFLRAREQGEAASG